MMTIVRSTPHDRSLAQGTARRARRAALVGAATVLAAALAHADGGPRVPLLPAYVQECGSCHMAYPPGLLPAASWQRLMSGLPKHFGTDASLDAESTTRLAQWLAAHAATGRRAEAGTPTEDRITRSAWFVREHREVPRTTWSVAAVRTPANCAACHTQAARGIYDEHQIRIPR